MTTDPERMAEVGLTLARHGVTAYLPTVITSAPEQRDRALAAYPGAATAATGAFPLGLHIEGPMLDAARRGAHPERWLRTPSLELVAGWSREGGVVMVTLAPELPGALDVIASLVERGVVVSLGHTSASAEQVRAAVARGARCVTHLFNAMPPLHHREAGPVGVALGSHDLVAGVIADGHHVERLALQVAWSALGPTRFLAVSDATAALDLPDGPTILGERDVIVLDGTVRLADGTMAGSAAALPRCLQVMRETTGAPLADVLATATSTPAELIGDRTRGRLVPGCRGDLALWRVTSDALEPVATVVGGKVVHDARAVS